MCPTEEAFRKKPWSQKSQICFEYRSKGSSQVFPRQKIKQHQVSRRWTWSSAKRKSGNVSSIAFMKRNTGDEKQKEESPQKYPGQQKIFRRKKETISNRNKALKKTRAGCRGVYRTFCFQRKKAKKSGLKRKKRPMYRNHFWNVMRPRCR